MSRTILAVLTLWVFATSVRADAEAWLDAMKTATEVYRADEYRRAKELFTQALDKAEGFENAESRRAETIVQVAKSLHALGEYARCEQLCNDVIGRLEKQSGEQHPQIAQAEKVLAELFLSLGLSRLADRHCSRGLKICETFRGKEHPEVADFQALKRHLWNFRSGDGNSGGGELSLQILEKSFGDSDPRLIVALEALAGDCYDRWTPELAARARSIAEKFYGKRHPVYGHCLSTLATAHRQIGEFEKSELYSKLAIEVLTRSLGPDHPQLSPAYRNLASIERERGHSDQAEAHFRDSIRLNFSTLSDADLCHFCDYFMNLDQRHSYQNNVFDVYLTEMIRRGGGDIQQFLEKIIQASNQQYLQAVAEQNTEGLENDEDFGKFMEFQDRMERHSQNLEIVTALCRTQKKPDPLQIFIKGPQELTCEFPDLPDLEVAIRNVDSEKREIGFTESGDYRSGRQARWRIEVRDTAGEIQPFKKLHGIVYGGGLYQSTTLKPEQGWQTPLVMAQFAETLEPGEYQVHVLYHNALTIVDWEFVAGLIVCQSDPIKLTVRRRSVPITKGKQQEFNTILAGFDDRQTRKIITGKYGPWAHEFIDPKSDYGHLLSLGWPAVPALIDELEREGQTPERRAHALGLLFSLTGENDPRSQDWDRSTEVLGKFSQLDLGWSVTSKQEGEDKPSSYSSGSMSGISTHNAKIDAKAQAPFLDRWRNFKKHLDVKAGD